MLATAMILSPTLNAWSKLTGSIEPEVIRERFESKVKVKASGVDLNAKKKKAEIPGQNTYKRVCSGCHQVGIAGCPKYGDRTAWGPRLKKGVEMMVKNAINGINAMPAKGGCMDCSDEEIELSVKYMLKSVE